MLETRSLCRAHIFLFGGILSVPVHADVDDHAAVPLFVDFEDELYNQMSEHQAFVEERLSVQANASVTIDVRVEDSGSGGRFYTGSTSWKDGTRSDLEILFSPVAVQLGIASDPKLLRHELAHAVIRSHLSRSKYRGWPDWAREGIAVWAADQLNDKLDVGLRAVVWNQGLDPDDWLLPDLGTFSSVGFNDYYLAGARFSWLEAHAGTEAVQGWVQDVTQGVFPSTAFAQRAGMSWSEVVDRSRAWAQKRMRERMDASGFDALRALAFTQDVDQVVAFIESHPTSPLRAKAVSSAQTLSCRDSAIDRSACQRWTMDIRQNRLNYHFMNLLSAELNGIDGLIRDGEEDAAIERYLALMEVAEPYVPFIHLAGSYDTMFDLHFSRGEYAEAKQFMEKLLDRPLSLDPGRRYWAAEAHLNLAILAHERGSNITAKRHLRQLHRRYPLLVNEERGILYPGDREPVCRMYEQLSRPRLKNFCDPQSASEVPGD